MAEKEKGGAVCVGPPLNQRPTPPTSFFLFFDYIEPQKSFPFISARTNEQRESARSICALYEQGWLLYKKKGAEREESQEDKRQKDQSNTQLLASFTCTSTEKKEYGFHVQ